jgi:hypothetical protein
VIEPVMCWKFFHDLFENNSMTWYIVLKNKLNSLCLEEDGLVSDYFNQIQRVLNPPTSIGVIVVDNELIIQIYPHFEIVRKSLLIVLCIEPQCLFSLK